MGKDEIGKLEWRINVVGGASQALESKMGIFNGLLVGFLSRIRKFFGQAWNIGASEPRKVMHCLKVGLALTFVSLFYYLRPLYDGVGGNAIWAVMTVVVVFEYTVGATLNKAINRTVATLVAGSLGLGVQWLAVQSGTKLEPVVSGFFLFIFASAATFSRFIPSVKARFDYGAMIFILTFSLVTVSGYRVDELFKLANERLSTIAIGTSLCILISMLISPVWAGMELHLLIQNNLEKLAESLDVCIPEYFNENDHLVKDDDNDHSRKLQGYKCVLNSKATEDTMANLARWEPPHGRFSFKHPWKQYLKVGASMRSCAYCIETLTGCVDSGFQVSDPIGTQLGDVCVKLSSASANVLRELSSTVKSMKESPKLHLLAVEMNFAVQELQKATTTFSQQLAYSSQAQPVEESSQKSSSELIRRAEETLQVLPLVTLVTLVIETATRVERLVNTVVELATLAKFKQAVDRKAGRVEPENELVSCDQNHNAISVMQRV